MDKLTAEERAYIRNSEHECDCPICDDLVERYELTLSSVEKERDQIEEYRQATLGGWATERLEHAEVRRERDRLREHILDIAAHATPYGDIPGEPGWVGTYLLTAGALHRALGTIGHTAPSCDAEARLVIALAERDRLAAVVAAARAFVREPLLEATFMDLGEAVEALETPDGE